MSKNIIDVALKRLQAIYYDKEGNPIPGKPLSNFEPIKSFIRHRTNEDLSPNTLSNDIKALIEFSKIIDKSLKDLTSEDIYEFFAYLNPKAKGTIGLYKIKIRIFLIFVGREDLSQLCTVKRTYKDRQLPEDLLTPGDVELLINSAKNLRDKAYIAVLYESGARKGELEELQLKHVSFDECGAVITIPKGKNGARRIRVVYATGYLRNWIDNHPLKNDRNAWLWASSWDESVHIDYKTLWSTLKRAADKAGIEKRVKRDLERYILFATFRLCMENVIP